MSPRLGVVSDTHDNRRNVGRIVELFNRAGVDQVVHTGDITQAGTLAVFRELQMPLAGVFGNNDRPAELWPTVHLGGFEFAETRLELSLGDRRVLVIHDPDHLDPGDLDGIDVVLHGHTHRRVVESRGRTLIFNPGECAGILQGYNTVGILELAELAVDFLRF